MKASLTWMKDYVPVDTTKPAQELADVLTQAGIPVEDVISMDPGLKKIFTGKLQKLQNIRMPINYRFARLLVLMTKRVKKLRNKS